MVVRSKRPDSLGRTVVSIACLLTAVGPAQGFLGHHVAGTNSAGPLRNTQPAFASWSRLHTGVALAGGGLGPSRAAVSRISMMTENQKKVNPINANSEVVIVGASRGIGLEMVKQVLGKGGHVIATHRGEATAELAALSKGNSKLMLINCDVTDVDSVKAAAALIKGKIRTGITHLIHNAGVVQCLQDPDLEWGQVSPQEMIDVFKINAIGPLLSMQAFGPLLAGPSSSHPSPVVAILSSKVGSVEDNASGGLYAYRASKSAANNIAKSLSVDLADRANVVLLHPGYVRTDMTDNMGFIDPPESVTGMLKAIEATGNDTPFRWVDYKAEIIPF